METAITLPLWLFVLLLLTALLLLLVRVLLPGFRWYLRCRVNRVIEEVNTRLDIEIRPFQLTRKQALAVPSDDIAFRTTPGRSAPVVRCVAPGKRACCPR